MFSIFPDGWPGIGLLLLRVAVGGGLIAQGILYLGSRHSSTALCLIVLSTTVTGILLIAGLLTRFAGVVTAALSAGSLFSWFPCAHAVLFETHTTSAMGIVMAAALVCLGGGAYSVDARLFGRREVIIPKGPYDSQS